MLPVWTGKRILLAEDDGEMCSLLRDSLRQDGYDIIEAENGTQLHDYISQFRGSVLRGRFFDVDLIISDIRMPGMSGLKVLSELRRFDRQTPVILITAFGDERTHAEARHFGAVAVFNKPFDIEEFRTFIRNILPMESSSPEMRPG